MNRAKLIAALAEKSGLNKQKTKKVLESYVEIVTEKMCQNEEIAIVGFGTLSPRKQSPRMARNPKTGEPVQIRARTTVKFKPGKFLLEAINGKK
ncbi:HU family DNA-binding protein [Parabacteroides timonensis]|uniref:HU family DNA-binding protein n=1 Tax=Parabacteroides timonensis TaxID=1871013 RepID=UPI00094E6B6F|nr:HU family DNA-binding protein [Parabacteroides timonensis]